MQLPILSSLTTLFSKVTDDFKTLFQSWSLVAAGIYLFLNIVLVFPVLRRVPAVRAYQDLETLVQTLVGTLILFGFGYLINSLGGFFVALANGRLLRHTATGWALRGLERWRYGRLVARLENPHAYAQGDPDRAAYRLAYEFPDKNTLTPTRLGNIQAAVADYSVNQYGAHLDTVWPIVETALGKEDEPLLKKIGDEQIALTFLSTLAVLLGLTAMTAVPLRAWLAAWLGQPAWPLSLPVFVALLVVGYICYRAAALRAAAWGRLVRLALDLHLDEAETSLGLRALTGEDRFEARKKRWGEVSEWLAYGGLVVAGNPVIIPKPSAAWYDKPGATDAVSLTCSAQLKADVHAAEQTAATPRLTANRLLVPGPVIEYVIPITHAAAADEPGPLPFRSPTGGFLRLSDSRIPFIPSPPAGQLVRPDGDLDVVNPILNPAEGGPDALLWRVPGLDYRDSATLLYALDGGWRLTASGATLVSVGPARSGRAGLLAVRLRVIGRGENEIKLAAGPLAEERVKGAARWDPPGAARPQAIQPEYDPAPDRRRAVWTLTCVLRDNDPAEVVVLLPVKDHGLDEAVSRVAEGFQRALGVMGGPIGDLPPVRLPVPPAVLDAAGKAVKVVLPPRGRLKPLADATQKFKAIANDCDHPDKAAAALDRYDWLSDAAEKRLPAADLNNLACFMAWQKEPDAQQTYRLLQRACEKREADETIRANLNALAPPRDLGGRE